MVVIGLEGDRIDLVVVGREGAAVVVGHYAAMAVDGGRVICPTLQGQLSIRGLLGHHHFVWISWEGMAARILGEQEREGCKWGKKEREGMMGER
jgi:hypothetical protein